MNAASFPHAASRAALGALLLSTLALACRVSAGTDPAATPPGEASSAAPPSQPPVIDPSRMFADLEYLSSDELAGRYTFSDELGVAADYLAKQYTAMGIGPVGESYRVPFQAPVGVVAGDELTVWVEDPDGRSQQVAGKEITTLANGSGHAAYGEAVAVASLDGARSRAIQGKVVVAPAPPVDVRNEAIVELAKQNPAGLLLVGERPPPNGEKSRKALGDLAMPVAWVSRETAAEWMSIEASGGAPTLPGTIKLSMAAKRVPEQKDSFNVLAVLVGREHPEQIVMLGAHYDHIGTSTRGVMCREKDGDSVCNGADDNASGTAMLLEIARAYTEAGYRPQRTVVFAHFAGEELGLHGSRALAKNPPKVAPFAGGEVVAMVNLDMVGRLGSDGLAIGGISSSDGWMSLLEPVEPEGLSIVYERAVNARSDHANFYRQKVPVLFFFTGLHDDYHKAGDHFDKINREGMVLIGQMVADLTRSLADGAPISYTPPRNDQEGVVSRLPGSRDATVERRSGPSGSASASGD